MNASNEERLIVAKAHAQQQPQDIHVVQLQEQKHTQEFNVCVITFETCDYCLSPIPYDYAHYKQKIGINIRKAYSQASASPN